MLAGAGTVAKNQAMAAGMTSGAELSGQLQVRKQIADSLMADPKYADMIKQDPMMQSLLVSAQLGTQMPYGMMRMGMGGETANNTVAQALADPAWAHLVPDSLRNGDPNATIKMQRDQAGRPLSITPEILPALLPKTTSGSTTTPGGLTQTHQQTVTPQLPGAKPAAGRSAVPTQGGGGSAKNGKGPTPPPAVQAEMDNMMMYGMPAGKMSDAQALAEQAMRREGIDPQIAATVATRTMADKGRAILPLIEQARQFIASDPAALGPLSGRWSELEQKYGNLEGAPKQLAGTLISIYSMSGGLHGWRSMQVANEFKKAYGDLSNDPKSLNSGLDALANTANTIVKTAYPGQDNQQQKGTTIHLPSGKSITID